ncbi:MAG: PAS domain S-box protein [Negativicutes bacterium]|nr:PAS domain S-box protein [Negativicutes bacterium]
MDKFSISSLTQKIKTEATGLIILLGILLVAGLWLFVWQQTNDDYDRTIAETSKETMNLVHAFEEHVLRIVTQADKDLLVLRQAYEKDGPAGFTVTASKITVENDPSRNTISITNAQGIHIASSFNRTLGINSSDRDYFQTHRDGSADTLFISKPLMSRVTGKPIIVLSRRINNPDGSFGGVVYISLRINYFLDFYKKMDLGQSQLINLLGMDGVVRARQAGTDLSVGQDVRDGQVWKSAQSGRTADTFISESGLDKIKRITSYRVIEGYPLIILVSKSAEAALAPYEKRKHGYVIAASLTSLLIGVLSALWIERTRRALRDGERRYRALVKQSSEGILICEFPSMNIVEANKTACRMFGYTEEELLAMSMYDFRLSSEKSSKEVLKRMATEKGVPAAIRQYRHKDGRIISTERAGSLIEYEGKQLAILTYRDITADRNLQEQIQTEVRLAGTVQKAGLPGDYTDDKVSIRTIYEPVHLVSGDYYGYRWSKDGRVLNGFILDVTGHGMATALQTAAISTVLTEEMEREQIWSAKAMETINLQIPNYLPEESFAAILTFSLDFRARQLKLIAAGINYYLVSAYNKNDWGVLSGYYLGISETANFGETIIPFQHGDAFYFMTDGISDRMDRRQPIEVHDFAGTVEKLKRLADSPEKFDDCSALCIKVTGLPPYPVCFEYVNAGERPSIRERGLKVLAELAGMQSAAVEIAIGEAVVNGLQHGTKVKIKINKIGRFLVIRVRDDGPGFDGNAAIAAIRAVGIQEIYQARLWKEHDRGIPMMMTYMDRVIYNKAGNEVLMIKRLTGEGM